MLKTLFFKFIDIVLFCSKKNFYIVQRYPFTDGKDEYINYVYNGKTYTYVGSDFPPKIQSGFVPCIKHAHSSEGTDITSVVKKHAGPKHDFYGCAPDPSSIIGTRFLPKIGWDINYGRVTFKIEPVLKKGPSRPIYVTDIFNRTRVLEKT